MTLKQIKLKLAGEMAILWKLDSDLRHEAIQALEAKDQEKLLEIISAIKANHIKMVQVRNISESFGINASDMESLSFQLEIERGLERAL